MLCFARIEPPEVASDRAFHWSQWDFVNYVVGRWHVPVESPYADVTPTRDVRTRDAPRRRASLRTASASLPSPEDRSTRDPPMTHVR